MKIKRNWRRKRKGDGKKEEMKKKIVIIIINNVIINSSNVLCGMFLQEIFPMHLPMQQFTFVIPCLFRPLEHHPDLIPERHLHC